MTALMNDPTLRRGDAVMMTQGIMVFEGSVGEGAHQADDFVTLTRAVTLSQKERGRILALSSNSQNKVENNKLSSSYSATQRLAGQ